MKKNMFRRRFGLDCPGRDFLVAPAEFSASEIVTDVTDVGCDTIGNC